MTIISNNRHRLPQIGTLKRVRVRVCRIDAKWTNFVFFLFHLQYALLYMLKQRPFGRTHTRILFVRELASGRSLMISWFSSYFNHILKMRVDLFLNWFVAKLFSENANNAWKESKQTEWEHMHIRAQTHTHTRRHQIDQSMFISMSWIWFHFFGLFSGKAFSSLLSSCFGSTQLDSFGCWCGPFRSTLCIVQSIACVYNTIISILRKFLPDAMQTQTHIRK